MALLALLLSALAWGADNAVASVEALQARLEAAKPGDTIVVKVRFF